MCFQIALPVLVFQIWNTDAPDVWSVGTLSALLCVLPAAISIQIQLAEEQAAAAVASKEAAEAECGAVRRKLAAAEGRLSLMDGLEEELSAAKLRASNTQQAAQELQEQLRGATAEAEAAQQALKVAQGKLEEAEQAVQAAEAAAAEARHQRCVCL